MSPRRRSTSPPLAAAGLALVVVLGGCGDGDAADDEPTVAATTAAPAPASPASPEPSEPASDAPTPSATGMAAGEVLVDFSALATGDVAAAAEGPLDVQTCLGGQCTDEQVDPALDETLSLDTSGLRAGDATIVTVRVTAPDGSVLVQQDETVTLGEGETTVAVEPDDG